jgi:hypothetical protein
LIASSKTLARSGIVGSRYSCRHRQGACSIRHTAELSASWCQSRCSWPPTVSGRWPHTMRLTGAGRLRDARLDHRPRTGRAGGRPHLRGPGRLPGEPRILNAAKERAGRLAGGQARLCRRDRFPTVGAPTAAVATRAVVAPGHLRYVDGRVDPAVHPDVIVAAGVSRGHPPRRRWRAGAAARCPWPGASRRVL